MFFCDSELVLEIIGIFKIKRDNYIVENAVTRSYDTLSIRLCGRCEFVCKNTDMVVSEDDILYIPSTINYNQKTDGEEIIAIHFINYNKKNKSGIEVFSPDNPLEFRSEIIRMYEIWNEKKTGYRQKCTSMLYNILYKTAQKLEERSFETQEINRIMNKAINYIHQNYKNESILISEIAKSLFISETYFRRLFKKSYGVSPNKYITSLKLEYASQMLASGFYSVAEASINAGFSDTKYFSRLFKKHYLKTPLEYKKEFQKIDEKN